MQGLTLVITAETTHKNKLLCFFLIFSHELALDHLLQFLSYRLNLLSYRFHHTSAFEQVAFEQVAFEQVAFEQVTSAFEQVYSIRNGLIKFGKLYDSVLLQNTAVKIHFN